MANTTRTDVRPSLRAGVLGGLFAGLIAGIVMAMVAMIRASALGLGFWLPVKQIAALWYGTQALIVGAGAIWAGLLSHMMMSVLFGILFGAAVGRDISVGGSFAAGLVYGIVIWAVMTWIVLPFANEVMLERVTLMPWWWFGYHLIFGGMLLLTPPLVKAFAESRPSDREPAPRSEGEYTD